MSTCKCSLYTTALLAGRNEGGNGRVVYSWKRDTNCSLRTLIGIVSSNDDGPGDESEPARRMTARRRRSSVQRHSSRYRVNAVEGGGVGMVLVALILVLGPEG